MNSELFTNKIFELDFVSFLLYNTFWMCLGYFLVHFQSFINFVHRKAWHLIGFSCVLISFPFIFSLCIQCSDADQYAQIIYFGSFMIIFQFGWASTQISHLATIPDLAKNQADRTDLTAIRYTMTNLSTIFVYIIGDLLLLLIF